MEVRPGTTFKITFNKSFLHFNYIPAVSNKLREISTTTDILSDNPTSLQEEVLKAVKNINSRTHENPR